MDDPSMAELKLKSLERQTRYKRLFNNTSIGILLIDAHNRIVDANRQALKWTGYTFDEMTSLTTQDLIHPDNLNSQPLITAKEIPDGVQEIILQRHYLCKNGRYIPVDARLRVFHDDMLIVTFQDISREKASVKALREANEALEVIYRCANAAIVSLDRNAHVTLWNPAAEKMFGWTQDEVVGKPYPAVPDELAQEYCDYFNQEVTQGQSVIDKEVVRQRKDGSRFHASVTTGPTHNESGEVTGLISVIIDITQRKEAELALQQSEERYRSLVENTQDGYFICDVDTGKFCFLNQRMCDLLHYTPAEVIGLTLWDILCPEDHGAMRTVLGLKDADSSDSSNAHTYQAVNKNGTVFRAEISVSKVIFEEKPAIQGLFRDVTEKERLHARLQQAQRLESVGTLAGGIAHDFNNLLMAIHGNASLALDTIDNAHPVRGRLKQIITYAQDASGMTRQLLGFARGGKYEVQATDLNQLIEKNARMFGRTRKQITIRFKLQRDIWTVAVDRGQIEQVLLNLLVNAGHAMPKGGHIIIQTSNEALDTEKAQTFGLKAGDYIKTSITDSGTGMDKTTLNKIFEPFFTTKKRGRGTGLGLASSYGIIKNHGGAINVYSKPGIGATFIFHLPATQETAPAPIIHKQNVVYGTETILLVDDEAMVVDVTKEMLEGLGYATHTAHNGRDAIDIYQKNQKGIDIIILDMIMPGMSGEDTYRRLKQINPKVPVLLSSGYSLDENTSVVLADGCNGFIQKPFTFAKLSQKIRQILDNR